MMTTNEQPAFEGLNDAQIAEAVAAASSGLAALDVASRGKATLDPSVHPFGTVVNQGDGSRLVAPTPAEFVRSGPGEVVSGGGVRSGRVGPIGGENAWFAYAPSSTRLDQVRGLVNFVEWVATTYKLNRKELPPCWLLHPGLVAEYHALWRLHDGAYRQNEGKSQGPYNWHTSLHNLRTRLRASLESSKCEQGNHNQDEIDGNFDAQRLMRFQTYEDLQVSTVGDWGWPEVGWTYDFGGADE